MSAKPGYALLAAGLLAAGFTGSATAATVVINNTNAAGVGFNDASAPNAAAGCNTGETLGACRLRVFNKAAEQWGAILISDVTITVNGSMIAQTCTATGATLGSAGPNTAHANFANAPRADTAYVQALANSRTGTDLSTQNDLTANFNVSIDAGCLSGTAGWWYNTDPNVPVPSDRTPLLPVVFHEIGHGIGFTSLYSPSSGAASTTQTPAWGYYLYDIEAGKLWKDMTNAERAASAINDPDLVWTGPLTNQWAPAFLRKPAAIIINSPAAIAGVNTAQTAEFGPSVASSPVTAAVVLVNDGVAATSLSDGCETPFTNAAAVAGKIALIDRGTCNFTVKVKNAQLNGAIGVIVANNVATGLPGMGGSDSTITIPSLGSTQALGDSIKTNLLVGAVNATLGVDSAATDLAGTNSGCIRMYAPNPVESGSSVSHFSADAFPNLLMEPALNRSIFDKVDLTLPLFRDLGWNTNAENILFRDGFDNNPCQFVQP